MAENRRGGSEQRGAGRAIETSVQPPRPISPGDDCGAFDCGHPDLNAWLRERSLSSEGRSARTYVVTTAGRVIAYSCLAAGAVVRTHLGRAKLRANLPDQVPIIVLGRLAVDLGWQGRGIGQALLKDAILRALGASELVGVRAIVVHAIDEAAVAFYRQFGFLESPMDPRTLLLPLETARAAL